MGMEGEIFRISDGYLVEKINEFSAIGAGQIVLVSLFLPKV